MAATMKHMLNSLNLDTELFNVERMTDLKFLQEFATMVEYTGFDAKVIAAAFVEKWANIGAEVKASLKDKLNVTSMTVALEFLIVIYLTRGTRIQKITGKMDEKISPQIVKLFSSFEIKDNIKNIEKSKKVLTLSRIANAFAPLTTRIAQALRWTPVGYDETLGLPKALCWPGAASIIPANANLTFQQWVTWSARFTKIISKVDEDTAVDTAMRYGMIMLSSNTFSDELRNSLMEAIDYKPKTQARE